MARPAEKESGKLLHSVSVVAPVRNEAGCVQEFVARCLSACDALQRPYELLLIDDCSTDASREQIAEAAREHEGRVVGVLLEQHCGQQEAVVRGFAESRGAYVVTLDADLQNPPEELPRLIEQLDAGFQVVGTVRRNRRDGWSRRATSWTINTLVRWTLRVHLRDNGCMLRGYQRQVVDGVLAAWRENLFVPVLALRLTQRVAEIEVDHAPRTRDRSKYGLRQLPEVARRIATSLAPELARRLALVGLALLLLGALSRGLFGSLVHVLASDASTALGVGALALAGLSALAARPVRAADARRRPVPARRVGHSALDELPGASSAASSATAGEPDRSG